METGLDEFSPGDRLAISGCAADYYTPSGTPAAEQPRAVGPGHASSVVSSAPTSLRKRRFSRGPPRSAPRRVLPAGTVPSYLRHGCLLVARRIPLRLPPHYALGRVAGGGCPPPAPTEPDLWINTSGSSEHYPKTNRYCCPSMTGWVVGGRGLWCFHVSHSDTSRSANQALGYARCIPRMLPLAQWLCRLHAVVAADPFDT